jgi:hypothetical protein
MILSGIISCTSIRYIPIETKVIERDTLIKVDSIIVQLPIEVKNNNVPYNKKSVLETSLAKSEAYLDSTTNELKHSLENKPQSKLKADTVFKVKIKEVEKQVPVEVIKEVPYIPNIYKYSLIFSILIIVIGVLKLKGIF